MIPEEVLEKMERYGGSFVKKLAELYRLADPFNKKKLEKYFREYFEEYRNFGGEKNETNEICDRG